MRKQTSLIKLDKKVEPRSERRVLGAPWRGIISLTKVGNGWGWDVGTCNCKTFHPTRAIIREDYHVTICVGGLDKGSKTDDCPAISRSSYWQWEQKSGLSIGVLFHGT